MKKINLKYILSILALVFILGACNESEDLLTADANEGGAILSVAKSSGKILGVPDANGVMTFTDTELSFDVRVSTGGSTVSSYDIVKSFNGGDEIAVTNVTALPFALELTTIDEFLAGTGVNTADVRVGDAVEFGVYLNLADGRRVKSSPKEGSMTLTVKCSSDLAGSYTSVIVRDDGSSWTYDTEVTEVGPGEYQASRSGGWAVPAGFFTSGGARMLFNDVCGELFIPEQQLNLGQYSNDQYGPDTGATAAGTADIVNGVLRYEYTITFSAGPSVYMETLTKK